MTLSRGLTSRQLFFVSAAYLFSGFFVFRTRGVSVMVTVFLLWSLFSGIAFMMKRRERASFVRRIFRIIFAICSAVTASCDVFSLFNFSAVDKSGVPPLVFTFSLVAIAVFLAYKIKLVGRLAELTPYIFAAVLLTAVPYMKASLSLFDGSSLSVFFFPSVPLLLCDESRNTTEHPSAFLSAEKSGLHPLLSSMLGALVGEQKTGSSPFSSGRFFSFASLRTYSPPSGFAKKRTAFCRQSPLLPLCLFPLP